MNTERIWSAKLQPIRSCLTRFIDHIDRSDPHSDSSCVFTGLTDLDYYMSPMRPGEICIIAARPSIGKTALTENIIEHAAIKEKIPVIYSPDYSMNGQKVMSRLVSSLGRIDYYKLRTGRLGDDDRPRMISAVSILSDADISVLESATLEELLLTIEQEGKRETPLLLAIDDIDKLCDNNFKTLEIFLSHVKESISNKNVLVVLTVTLGRIVESRDNKRPKISDLRSSSSIDKYADRIIFIYRDDVYHEDSTDKGLAEILIDKDPVNHGGTVKVGFLGKYLRFEDFPLEQRA